VASLRLRDICPPNANEALALNDHLTLACVRDVFEVISIPFAGGDFTDVHSVQTASDVELVQDQEQN